MSGKKKRGYDQGEVQMSTDAIQMEEEKTNKNTQATMIGLVPLVCCCMFTVTFIAQ